MRTTWKRVRRRLFGKWYTAKARWEYGPKWNWGTTKIFLRMARLAARGRLKVMDSKETESRGGYKYLLLSISKMPVSADHSYDEL